MLRIILKSEQFSDTPWSQIDKTKLPRGCFLYTTGDKKEDWHLPYKEGTGGIDSDTGMYRHAGQVNRNALKAIKGALAGARTGKAMRISAEARAKFERLYKAAFGDET